MEPRKEIRFENGHRYEITFDQTGREVEKVVRDIIPPIAPAPRPPEIQALLDQDTAAFSIKDLATLVKYLIIKGS